MMGSVVMSVVLNAIVNTVVGCKRGRIFVMLLFLGAVLSTFPAYAQNNNEKTDTEQREEELEEEEEERPEKDAMTMEELLRHVREGLLNEQSEHREREARFRARRDEQAVLLAEAEAERRKEELRSERLEAEFEKNQDIIAVKREQLQASLGSLIELFGHMTIAANDLRSNLLSSVVSAQHGGRIDFLDTLLEAISESDSLPSMDDVERLWFEMQREMIESGKIVRFDSLVTEPDGTSEIREVVRVGSFNVVDDDGNYLSWSETKGKLLELPRQPADQYRSWAKRLARADEDDRGFDAFALDPTGPTGGSFLASLIDAPTLGERWRQGGIIGFIISLVGLFAMWLAITRLIQLRRVAKLVDTQMQTTEVNTNNPLGRVLKVYEDNMNMDVESLELKISEAIVRERPQLERGHALLKIIAAIAPLMGLLGTVTGMILTFQGIVIFGAGDPKAMAGGISQALVTTVLGLVVAIPTVLLHTMVSGRSARVLHILEEQALGIIAKRAEAK